MDYFDDPLDTFDALGEAPMLQSVPAPQALPAPREGLMFRRPTTRGESIKQGLLWAIPAALAGLAMKQGPASTAGLLGGVNVGLERQRRNRMQDETLALAAETRRAELARRAALDEQRRLMNVADLTSNVIATGASFETPEEYQGYLQQMRPALTPLGVDVDALGSTLPAGYARKLRADAQKEFERYTASIERQGDKDFDPDNYAVQFRGQPMSLAELAKIGGMPLVPKSEKALADGEGFEAQVADKIAEAEEAKGGPLKPAERARLRAAVRRDWMEAGRRAGTPHSGDSFFSKYGEVNPTALAEAIMRGDLDPTMTGFYGASAAVQTVLAQRGFDLSGARLDYHATKRRLSTMNGPQMARLQQAVDFTYHSLDVIEDLVKKWNAGQFPTLNRMRLAAARSGVLGKDAQALAAGMESQIADLVSELGTVYKGGNASTDHSLALAAQNLKADWSLDSMLANLKLIRKNLEIRRNSIKSSVSSLTSDGTNPYEPGGAPTQTTRRPATVGEKRRFRSSSGAVEIREWDGAEWTLVP